MGRRRKNSKAEALLGIIPAAFLALVLLISGGDLRKVPQVMGALAWIFFVLVIVGLVVGIAVLFYLKKGNARSTQEPAASNPSIQHNADSLKKPSQQLDAIDWFQFEKTIGRLMELEGWTVEMRGGAQDDGGVDLIATRGAETQLVQCKLWKRWDLNLRTVRELVGARESAEFNNRNASAWIYTLSEPTDRAVKFAAENLVSIVTRREFERRIDTHHLASFPELQNPLNKSCPKCGSPMVNRGKFWGCSNYGRTRCRGTIQIDHPPAA